MIRGREQLVRFISGIWTRSRISYATFKKEILYTMLSVQNFDYDLLNKKFLIRVVCKYAKDILLKNLQNIAPKQIFFLHDDK